MMSGKYQKEQLEIEARLKEVTETLSDSYETVSYTHLAHAEAMFMRVAGTSLVGYADNGGRRALPLP